MPANVRNFWVDVDNSTRKEIFGTGPRSKDGTLDLHYYIRNKGSIDTAFYVQSFTGADGRLVVRILDADDNVVHEVKAQR